MSSEDPVIITEPYLGQAKISGGYDDQVCGSFTTIDLSEYTGSQFSVMLNKAGRPCQRHDESMFWIITLPLPKPIPHWILVLAALGAAALTHLLMSAVGVA